MACPRRQRGAISPAIAVGIILMSVLALGAICIGRIAITRADAQRAADAAVLAAAQLMRERGFPFDGSARASAESLARGNSQLPIAFEWAVTQTAETVDVEVTARITLSMPTLVFSSGSTEVSARSRGKVTQSVYSDAERRFPKLVLALDYSGSMGWSFVGGGRKLDALESSVAALLGADLMVEYGAVFFDSSVFRTIPVGPGAPTQILSTMAAFDTRGATNSAAAIYSARDLVTAGDNTGRYILFVSDGAPCCSGSAISDARAAAVAAWNSDATIFTLEIRDTPPVASLAQFMTDIAGSPTDRGNPAYHYVASTAADLLATFQNIVAAIVCRVGPLDPIPTDTSTLHVFLTDGATERVLPVSSNLAADAAIEAWRYNVDDNSVRLTMAACDAIIDNGDDIILRFDPPSLTE